MANHVGTSREPADSPPPAVSPPALDCEGRAEAIRILADASVGLHGHYRDLPNLRKMLEKEIREFEERWVELQMVCPNLGPFPYLGFGGEIGPVRPPLTPEELANKELFKADHPIEFDPI